MGKSPPPLTLQAWVFLRQSRKLPSPGVGLSFGNLWGGFRRPKPHPAFHPPLAPPRRGISRLRRQKEKRTHTCKFPLTPFDRLRIPLRTPQVQDGTQNSLFLGGKEDSPITHYVMIYLKSTVGASSAPFSALKYALS